MSASGAGGLLLAAMFALDKNAIGVIAALAALSSFGTIPVFWQIPPRFLSGYFSP